MLVVAEELDELLDVDWGVVLVEVTLRVETAVVNQEVGIGDDTRDGAHNVVVHFVELAGLTSRYKEWRELFFLGCEDHTYLTKVYIQWLLSCAKFLVKRSAIRCLTFFGENADHHGVLIYMFDGIFDLQQATIRVERSCALVVLSRLYKNITV